MEHASGTCSLSLRESCLLQLVFDFVLDPPTLYPPAQYLPLPAPRPVTAAVLCPCRGLGSGVYAPLLHVIPGRWLEDTSHEANPLTYP